MHGFYDRILKIDVTDKTFAVESIDERVLETYMGGKGLASYLLYHLNPPGVDPLNPANCLIFATGAASGSSIWGGCRYGIYTKSPQTGFYSESYSGGKVPEAIDATGFDAIVIQGKSAEPLVLSVFPDRVEFHPAGDIWGMDTYQAEDEVKDRFPSTVSGYGRPGVVVIGPAGENLVRFAVVENDYWRSAGRTGVGTVMGSKKIKAIRFQGDQKRPLSDIDAVRVFAGELAEEGKNDPGAKAYKAMGTPMMVKIVNNAKAFPTRYWSAGTCDHWEDISADALHERCSVKPKACLKCFMACGRMTEVLTGRHAGLKLEGPEYETIYAFGGLCLVDSIEEIAFLNDLCDRLGLDTITAGNLCGFVMEAAKQNRVDYQIEYGDVDAIAELLGRIARREGIGDTLSQGIVAAANAWHLEDLAVHVKGLEPAGYDPRVFKGMGLAYATSDRGACHLRSTFYKPELSGIIDPSQIKGKAELFLDYEDRLTLFDTLILCRFYRDLYTWEKLSVMIPALTGLHGDKEALREKAAAITDIIRKFNLREGLTTDDDRLPRRLHQELDVTGAVITEEELEEMLADYYTLRGWDEKGQPPA